MLFKNSGSIQAITADGDAAWTATLDSNYSTLNADFLGGLVETTASTVTWFDGLTGKKSVLYTYASPGNLNIVSLGTDGTIFTIDGDSVVGIDPKKNAVKFTVGMDGGADFEVHTCEYTSTVDNRIPPSGGSPILAGDGNFYVPYQYTSTSYSDAPLCSGDAYFSQTSQVLLRVGPDGSSSKIVLGGTAVSDEVIYFSDQYNGGFIDTHSESGQAVNISSMASNADQGVIVSYTGSGKNAYCSTLTYYFHPYSNLTTQTECVPATGGQPGVMNIGGLGPTPQPGTWANFTPMLQGIDGTFYGIMSQGSLSALDAAGNVKWTVPNYTPVMLTAAGNILAQSASRAYVSFNQNGVAQDQFANFPTLSWAANANQIGVGTDSVVSAGIIYGAGYSVVAQGNPSHNLTPVPVAGEIEAVPEWGLAPSVPKCSLGSNNASLGNPALQQYNNLKQQLLNDGYLTSPSCSAFFNANGTTSRVLRQPNGSRNATSSLRLSAIQYQPIPTADSRFGGLFHMAPVPIRPRFGSEFRRFEGTIQEQ